MFIIIKKTSDIPDKQNIAYAFAHEEAQKICDKYNEYELRRREASNRFYAKMCNSKLSTDKENVAVELRKEFNLKSNEHLTKLYTFSYEIDEIKPDLF